MNKRIIVNGGGGIVLGLWLGFFIANHTAVAGANNAVTRAATLPVASETELLSAQQQSGSVEKPAEQVFKNIQSLKGLPASQLYATMNFMKASLGVKCDYCHVRAADGKWLWESDEKQTKQFTRRMIQLTVDSNKSTFGGRTVISCFTCHRGKNDPVNVPPFTLAAEQQSSAAVNAASVAPNATRSENSAPTVDQILNKYIEATGGRHAVESFKTQFSKGTLTEHSLPASPLEIYQEAPNKLVAVVTTAKGTLVQGFNGAAGWASSGGGTQALTGSALAQIKRRADFYGNWKLKEQFARLRVVGNEKINNREAYVIAGRTLDNRSERLYFDEQTGLLLRRVAYIETMIGMIPEATGFEDYREVDGVKIPFTINRAQLDGFEASTIKFTEIKHNLPVDDAKFNAPAASK